jgi:hypothetical protein
MSADSAKVSLADAIASLRKEIQSASRRAQTLDPKDRYKIAEAQIELTVVADDSAEGSAELGWWVLKAKAGISAKESVSHKVMLKLQIGDVEVGAGRNTP